MRTTHGRQGRKTPLECVPPQSDRIGSHIVTIADTNYFAL